MPVTVVIPAYNREALIGEALASIRAQTHPPAEIVVVDDGSTDATSAVALGHGARVIAQPNRGVSVARNVGVRAASQPWIAFLDSDDVWLPEKLERQWLAVQTLPAAGVVFCDYRVEEDDRLFAASYLSWRDVHRRLELTVGEGGAAEAMLCDPQRFEELFLRGNFMTPSTMLVRRDLLLAAGLFDEGIRFCEDYELTLRLIARARVALVDRVLVRYRRQAGSASRAETKLECGMVAVMERIAAHPERYGAITRAYARSAAPDLTRRAGVALLRFGEEREARRYLARSFGCRPRVATAVAYLAALAFGIGGRHSHALVRDLWRRWGRGRRRAHAAIASLHRRSAA